MTSRRDLPGFALLEVLIALVLLAGGAAALLRLQLQALRLESAAAYRIQAEWIAGRCLNRLLAQAGGPASGPPPDCPVPAGWRIGYGCSPTACSVTVVRDDPEEMPPIRLNAFLAPPSS